MSAERRKRHLRILELVEASELHTQEELAEALAREGWELTQSTVSRDITELELVKVRGAYRRPLGPSLAQADPDERRLSEGVLAVDTAGDSLLVLHTPPGEANRVAVAIDRLAWPEVVGTVAGDDTVFVAARHAVAQRATRKRLTSLLKAGSRSRRPST
jgi:transcriptional regulator of arginine metabolism